jgi:hypothetical protein
MKSVFYLFLRIFRVCIKTLWVCMGMVGVFSLYALNKGGITFWETCRDKDGNCTDIDLPCLPLYAAEGYDVIQIPFPDLATQAPAGRQTKIRGIVLHAPELPSVFKTISVLQNRSVGCHYIVPQHTLYQLQQEAKFLLAQQESLPESEKLSPVALKACHIVLNFQGSRDRIPVIQLADDHTGVKQAGLGRWKNWTCDVDGKLNSATIGIECANSITYQSSQVDLFRYSGMQMQVLSALLKNLLAKHTLMGYRHRYPQ